MSHICAIGRPLLGAVGLRLGQCSCQGRDRSKSHGARPKYRNNILTTLDAADVALLEPHLEPVELEFRQRLEQPNRPIERFYFLESGLASVVAMSRRGRRQVEALVIGSEGMTGQAVVLGTQQSPYETFMQVAGAGHAIDAARLRMQAEKSPAMMACLLRFIHVACIQAGQTALANADGSVEERLCRWLLMSHDRLGEAVINVRLGFLALMMGVCRPGVTIALRRLGQKALVVMRRGPA